MRKRVLAIGGHGMLGRPVLRRLLKEGFELRALARNPEKARALLPSSVEIVAGDLKDRDSIARAAEGMEAVYLNLATERPSAPFRPELDGSLQVLKALEGREDILVARLSALGASPDENWPNSMQKWQADEALRNSSFPWIVFKPGWFMESLPLFSRRGVFLIPGKGQNLLHWIAGDDLGRQVAAAFRDSSLENREYNIEGREALSIREAAGRFTKALGKRAIQIPIPLSMLACLGRGNEALDDFHRLISHTEQLPEEVQSRESWELLGEPRMGIEDYVQYMLDCNDIPRKSF